MAKHRRVGEGKARLTDTQLLSEASAAFDRGDSRLGSQKLNEAVQSGPNNPLVYVALGQFCLKAGKAPDAEAAFSRALLLDPDTADAAAGLVKVRIALGRRDEAEELGRSLIDRFPKDIALGQIFCQILADRYDSLEVIGRLRDLVASHPESVAALNSLGKRLSEVGEFEESRKSFEQAIGADRSNSFAYLGWVQAKWVSAGDMDMVRTMESILSEAALGDRDRMLIDFALGKAFADLKEYEKSMTFFHEANTLRERETSRREPFQKDRYQSYLDLTKESFTREAVESRQTSVDSNPIPIFIFGMFRSGTTLVEQILSSHSSVEAGGEIPYWLNNSAALFDHERHTFDFERASAMRGPYLKKLREVSPSAKFVTDKLPGNYRILGLLRILFPNAKFIHCVRHPVDTCLSIYMTPFSTAPSYSSDPEKLVFTYELYRQTMDHWTEVIGADAIYEVHYEELIDRPEEITRGLLSFCGLPFESSCLTPETNPRTVKTASAWQVRQPIYRSASNKWRQYEPWLGVFRKLIP